MSSKVKAVGLFSGGLDSILSFKLLSQQGIETIGVFFRTPFFYGKGILEVANKYGINLQVLDVTQEYLKILENPVCGYGRFFNPCIDCHAFMLSMAGKVMEKVGASFVFTGEVLGERPFSQSSYGLRKVEELSGMKGKILRPLSAKLLPVTEMEKKGLVDRKKLLAIKGRSRKVQFELAEQFGIEIEGMLQPAGGCLLTDPKISTRVKVYVKKAKGIDVPYGLIKTGRHFLLPLGAGLIVGRSEKENEVIGKYVKENKLLIEPISQKGPIGLLFGKIGYEARVLSCKIIASYCKGKEEVLLRCLDGDEIVVVKQGREEFAKYMI